MKKKELDITKLSMDILLVGFVILLTGQYILPDYQILVILGIIIETISVIGLMISFIIFAIKDFKHE